MAQENKDSGSNLPVASIVALLLFASGLWVQHQPLQTERPGIELKQQKDSDIYQDVEARLWQDPLEAVKQARTADAKSSPAGEKPDKTQAGRHKSNALAQWIVKSNQPQVRRLLLPVMVFGGPYAEDAEQRRRSRYAVLSGLREAGYSPDNSRNIGYLELSSPRLLLPFEKWVKRRSDKTRWEEVYVLWVVEEGLGEHPLVQLGQILDTIVAKVQPAPDVTVLGPAGYRLTAALAQALTTPRPGDKQQVADTPYDPKAQVLLGPSKRKVRFIAPAMSYSAPSLARLMSAEDPSSRGSSQDLKREQERLAGALKQPLEALRVGPHDAQLASLLVEELAHRGVALPSIARPDYCNDQVALVVEADTHYARSLSREFNQQLKPCRASFRPMVFHYFRGLDGKVAKDSAQESKAGDKARDKSAQSQDTPLQERAQGQGQFDYLRRIADEIRRRSDAQHSAVQDDEERLEPKGGNPNERAKEAQSAPHRGAVRAVIVLGSDIHDKLVILHALRESLPHALFATTDLDAGLLQKEQLPWTRNLIVASGFDFKLPPALQKGAPPFRDSYQTASYLATRKALAEDPDPLPGARAKAEPAPMAELRTWIRQASGQRLLFEIGNQRAVPLGFALPDAASAPAAATSAPGTASKLLLSLFALLVLFGLAVSWCLRQLLADLWQRRPYAIGSVATAVGAGVYLMTLLWVMAHVSSQAWEEPLSWQDGVSIWPGAMLRHAAGLLAVVLFLLGLDKLRKGRRVIESEFFQPELAQAKPSSATAPEGEACHGWSGFRDTWFPCTHGDEPSCSNRAYAVWTEYLCWTQGSRCCVRVLLGVLAALGMVVALLMQLGLPVTPVRGDSSGQLYYFLIVPSFLLMIVLLVWTLDRVALCSLFLRRLYGSQGQARRSGWSEAVQQKFCGFSTPAAPSPATPQTAKTDEALTTQAAALAEEDANAVQTYIDLHLSARISRFVGGIIIYPFVLALLLIMSRSRYFDNWSMTPGYLGVMVMILALVVLGAVTLRHNAERIRRYTIEQLHALEIRLRSKAYATELRATAEQVALMRRYAADLREGAFASFASQPIVRAILIPFGGAGLINLLDFALI